MRSTPLRLVVLLVLAWAVLVGGEAARAADGNRAPDPGFEAPGAPSWQPNGPCTFSQAAGEGRSGNALKIASTQPAGTLCRWLSVTSAIPAVPGGHDTAAVWIKTQGVVAGAARLTLTYWTASQAYVPGSAVDSAGSVAGTSDWTAVALQSTAPAGAAYVRVELRLTGPGTAWFDDVSVTSVVRAIASATPPVVSEVPGALSSYITGETLQTSLGTWTDAPDTFVIGWERCSPLGACAAIGGAGGPDSATARRYTLSNADVGYSVRSTVHASNASDPGATAASLPTPTVRSNCVVASDLCNVLPNGDVEQQPDPFLYTDGNAAFSWVSDVSHSPTHSLRIASTGPAGSLARWMSRTTLLPPDLLDGAAWVRTQGVDHGYAEVCLTYWRADGTYAGLAPCSTGRASGTQDWMQLRVQGLASLDPTGKAVPPAGTAYARLEVRLWGEGTVWIDDLRAERAFGATPPPPPPPPGHLVWKADFETGDFGDGVEATQTNWGPLPECQYGPTVRADAPLGWWRLDDLSGSATADDASTLGHPGRYDGSPVRTFVQGYAGMLRALTLDGVDNRLVVPGLPALAAVTYEAWARSTGTTWSADRFLGGRSGAFVLAPHAGSTTVSFDVTLTGGTTASASWTPPSGFAITAWHQYDGTYDGATVKLFVDGVLRASKAQTGTLAASTADLVVGQAPGAATGTGYGTGLVDSIAIWGSALADAKVKAHFDGGSCHGSTLEPAPGRPGHIALRTEVHPGDVRVPIANPDQDQQQLIRRGPPLSDVLRRGKELWVATSIYLDPTLVTQQTDFTVLELHQTSGAGEPCSGLSAPFNLSVSDVAHPGHDSWALFVRGGCQGGDTKLLKRNYYDLTDGVVRGSPIVAGSVPDTPVPDAVKQWMAGHTVPTTRGVWHDWLFGFFLSDDGTKGWIEAWHNGQLAVPRHSLPTWYATDLAGFLQAGIYRTDSVNPNVAVVYNDGVWVYDGKP